MVCKNKVLIGVSLYGFGNPGGGCYLRFVFYCNDSIILLVFLAKREGLFNLSHFLGDISRFRVAFTANVNVRFKLRNSQNRKIMNKIDKNSLIYETVPLEKTGINLLISVYSS